MSRTVRMTEGPIGRTMFFFILPLVGSSMFQQLYNTADFFLVSNFLGRTAAAAVGASGTLVTCSIGLFSGIAVGTAHTNTGAERALGESGITLLRTDVGDKYVAACMQKSGAAVGGEQSGHLILSDLAATGDGILASVVLAGLIAREKLSALADIRLLPQYNLNVRVKDKTRVLGNERVRGAIERAQSTAGLVRLVVRASGTEPLVRVFAEAEHMGAARAAAEQVRAAIAAQEE